MNNVQAYCNYLFEKVSTVSTFRTNRTLFNNINIFYDLLLSLYITLNPAVDIIIYQNVFINYIFVNCYPLKKYQHRSNTSITQTKHYLTI